MFKAIVTVGTVIVLSSLAPAAHAQSASKGSAASLSGLQERSVQQSSPRVPISTSPQSSTDIPAGSEKEYQLNSKVQLTVRPERGTSQVGVFPADDTASGNKVQVLYQIDQQ